MSGRSTIVQLADSADQIVDPVTEQQLPSSLGQKPASGSLPVVIASDQGAYIVRIDEATSTITYVGEAVPGTATSAASWRIKRLDSSSGLIVLYAAGLNTFSQVWDNRASLSYS